MFYEGCTTEEIRAYRELEGQIFDFGQGKMKMKSSEDIYYKMCLLERLATHSRDFSHELVATYVNIKT